MECKYNKNFLNDNDEEENFDCDEEPLDGKEYCMFHDKSFLKYADDYNVKKLKEKFKKKIEKHKGAIKCVGYILPDISEDISSKNVPIYFARAVFYEKVEFTSTIFEKSISFSYARFEKGLNFNDTIFKGNVDFSKATSKEKTDFRSCKFHKHANFAIEDFFEADFRNVIFHEEVDFSQGRITGKESYFSEAAFKKKSLFVATTFNAKTYFKKTIFCDEADFSKADFSKPIIFENTEFVNEEKVIFNGNIRNVSFLETQISKIKFGNNISWKGLQSNQIEGLLVDWWRLRRKYEKIINKIIKKTIKRKRMYKLAVQILNKFEKNEEILCSLKTKILLKIGHDNINYKIFDEHVLEKSKQRPYPLESIKDVYLQLIENFDKQMRYDLSGQFFVREMELKRKYKTNQKNGKIFTLEKNKFRKHISIWYAYNILALYGESYKRPICLMIPIIVLFTLYFLLSESPDLSLSNISSETLQNTGNRIVSGFFPFYNTGLTDKNKDLTHMDWLLRIILLPISGTFFVALKRKFERKFRH